jgi:hypothetical protein
MVNPRSAYYYYYYWVFARVSTHLTDETCNTKLGDHSEENIQIEGKLKPKLELWTNIQNQRRKIEVKIGATDKHTKPTKENWSIG